MRTMKVYVGAAAPAKAWPGLVWVDTSGGEAVIKFRNKANGAWITVDAASIAAKLSALDTAVTAIPNMENTALVDTDVDTPVELASLLNTFQARFNTLLNAIKALES